MALTRLTSPTTPPTTTGLAGNRCVSVHREKGPGERSRPFLLPYSPKLVEGLFCEFRKYAVWVIPPPLIGVRCIRGIGRWVRKGARDVPLTARQRTRAAYAPPTTEPFFSQYAQCASCTDGGVLGRRIHLRGAPGGALVYREPWSVAIFANRYIVVGRRVEFRCY